MALRWGILSTARIGTALLHSGSDQRFVAVASRDLERGRAFAAEHGIERAYGSYEELLADPDVDAVYNPLPNALHVPWSVRALEAGKHVLCEKPLSRDPDAVEAAFAVAQREGRVLAEAFMWRHHPQLLRVRELVADGAVGRLRLVRATFSFPAMEPDIRLEWELDGGGLMDVGCYCVSACRAIAGAEPERVFAEQVLGGDGVDVVMAATLRFPGDVLGLLDCGLALAARDELEVVGDAGSLWLDDPWHGRHTVIERRPHGGDAERIKIAPADAYALELADFEAAARGQRDPLLGRDDALGQARTIAALYDSAERNEPCPIA